MINCEITGKLVGVIPSRDNLHSCLNIQCYPNSTYTVSVLKCPKDLPDEMRIGDNISVFVVPKAFYSNGKAKVLYYYSSI